MGRRLIIMPGMARSGTTAIQQWLEKYSVPYDEIYMGKPWGRNAIYLDDKSVEISKFINN